MEMTTSPREGWIDVASGDVTVLAEGNPHLADALRGAIAGRDGETAIEAALDILTQAGWRQARDFALAATHGDHVRIVVRGDAFAVVATQAEAYDVRSPHRTPWLDTELSGVVNVHLETGLPEPEPEPSGWALPSAFGGAEAGAMGAGASVGAAAVGAGASVGAAGAAVGAGAIAPDNAPIEAEAWPGGLDTPHEPVSVDAAGFSAPAVPAVGGAVAAAPIVAPAPEETVDPAQAAAPVQAWGGERPEQAMTEQAVDEQVVDEPVSHDPTHLAESAPVDAPVDAPVAASGWEAPSHTQENYAESGYAESGYADSGYAEPGYAAASAYLGDHDQAPAGPVVLAVLCPQGHANAPHASHCRVCGEAIPPQQATEVARPALGVLTLTTGDSVDLDRGVLLGRSPKVAPDIPEAHRPHLVRVPSPDNDISRNHAEIILDGWYVLLQDLGSTNGTTLTLPGQDPIRLRPHEQTPIEPGAVFTLAEQVSVTFEAR